MTEMVLSWSRNYLLGFQDANGVCSGKVISDGSIVSNCYVVAEWTPPLGDLFKINMDVALNVEDNIVGMGVVIRNRYGEVMGSTMQRSEATYSPSLAEATVLLRGIEFMIDLGTLSAVVESDAKGVVKLINSGRTD
ncbi:hypothetical protein Ddye_020059 [Dipteronia dyeriana]|uniref:RNase H type-1 domain-containing protein n=1 Tax=Dipteronia dyeriana TaxID=168575 RepID=A0AAD9WV12_9ROSI|nr:hypothetical protein Ddye_020059 [Dipteronia dyeriana]